MQPHFTRRRFVRGGVGGRRLRSCLSPGHVEELGLWYNGLPLGERATCHLGPIKALPLISSKLTNPTVSVGDKNVAFPVTIPSGHCLEFQSRGDCKLFGPRGELVADVTPQGEPSILQPGDNVLRFDAPASGLSGRALGAVFTQGPPTY